ncbi:MAG: methylmalonyl Co-A mutase-associated GTPase MeaB [Gammaproteobacteria bacterium]|nr:methylmalonyl Co-A mutase-associated GTPase MeaB [Gammaproteobacteria bacterium]
MPSTPSAEAILSGDRRALAKAITLVESARSQDRKASQDLLNELLPHTGNSIRIGITGVPGVGKSTFIESFGQTVIGDGKKVAVLAVDPSSPVAGGSILGDKTRMEQLSRETNAFIRPSPAGKALGGVALKTRESMLLCEAAGFDVVVVETVGVGQSEHQVGSMVDFFLILLLPGGGDELQGIKKGILELADAILINKADGESENLANKTRLHYQSALSLLTQSGFWSPEVRTCSALERSGIAEAWDMVRRFHDEALAAGHLANMRSEQNLQWMWQLTDQLLRQQITDHPTLTMRLSAIEAEVGAATLTPLSAAQRIIDHLKA